MQLKLQHQVKASPYCCFGELRDKQLHKACGLDDLDWGTPEPKGGLYCPFSYKVCGQGGSNSL